MKERKNRRGKKLSERERERNNIIIIQDATVTS